jgi:hypothetical protein
MHRRRYLSLVSAGTLAVSGCLGGDAHTAIRNVSLARTPDASFDPGSTADGAEAPLTIRGAVVGFTPLGALVDDGTGVAAVEPADINLELNRDLVELGDCMTAAGDIDPEATAENELLTLDATDLDFGSGCDDADPLTERPSLFIDFEYDVRADETRFVAYGNEGVRAGDLVMRWRPAGSSRSWLDAEREAWHERTDLSADDPIPEDSVFAIDGDGVQCCPLWVAPSGRWSRRKGNFTT